MNFLTGGQTLCADCHVLIWLCRVVVAFVSGAGGEPVVPSAALLLVPQPPCQDLGWLDGRGTCDLMTSPGVLLTHLEKGRFHFKVAK